jgi:hypothetical protein
LKKQLRFLVTVIALLTIVLFILFVVNQTVQFITLVKTINERFGEVILYGLLIFYAFILIVPLYIYWRRPIALKPPSDERSPDYPVFLSKLAVRLRKNLHLRDAALNFSDPEHIRRAIGILDQKADELIKQTAATVFVTTAISQSGRLDAVFVLLAQTKMIYHISLIYHQRPVLKELARLYANVGATAFIAAELDDLDIGQQTEPVIAAAMGTSLVSVIPGFSSITSLVTNSLMDGAANAFLTLRVGMIARQYCGLMIQPDRKTIRRSATVMAAQMLGAIVLAGAKTVTSAIWAAAKRKIPGFK